WARSETWTVRMQRRRQRPRGWESVTAAQKRSARRSLWFDLRPSDASAHVSAVDPLGAWGKNNNTGRGPAWLEWLSTRFEDRASISARPPRSFHRLKAAHAAAASPARPRRRTERNKTPEETTSP